MTLAILTFAAQLLIALAIADAITGYIHYIEDEHPQWITRVFGEWGRREVTEPNIAHHKDPYAITRHSYWERNNTSIYAAIPVFLLAYWLKSDFLFLLSLIGSQANQIHYYAHLSLRDIPGPILFLQSMGILQSRLHHSAHHAAPYNTRFCVMTPWFNTLLERLYKGRRPYIVRCTTKSTTIPTEPS